MVLQEKGHARQWRRSSPACFHCCHGGKQDQPKEHRRRHMGSRGSSQLQIWTHRPAVRDAAPRRDLLHSVAFPSRRLAAAAAAAATACQCLRTRLIGPPPPIHVSSLFSTLTTHRSSYFTLNTFDHSIQCSSTEPLSLNSSQQTLISPCLPPLLRRPRPRSPPDPVPPTVSIRFSGRRSIQEGKEGSDELENSLLQS